MANIHKGEVSFKALGKTFVMRLDVDAICDAEAELDLGIEEIIERIRRGGNMRVARALIRAGTGGTFTPEQIAKVIKGLHLAGSMALCVSAIQAAFPPPSDDKENPPEGESPAADGTGKGS